MNIALDDRSVEDYRKFLAIKALPKYHIGGGFAEFPDEYAADIGMGRKVRKSKAYKPTSGLFDYQEDIARIAINKRKFAVFADCGLGKTLMLLEFARHAAKAAGKPILIVSPLMVVRQTMRECALFYGDELRLERVRAAGLAEWLATGTGIAVTNYEAMVAGLENARLGGLILDESSMLKSHYGKWGQACIELGRGIEWKLCLTGTPAPNDRIEYANHAVFLDQYPTVNSFLARFFVNRGHTDNRWELKRHAIGPFYRALSHWSIFVNNPAAYGWKDNTGTIPPIQVHIHNVAMTSEQTDLVYTSTGQLYADRAGGIVSRAALAGIAKGWHGKNEVSTNKPEFIRGLVGSWPKESTIIWCLYNREQEALAAMFPNAANIDGSTPEQERLDLIDDFKAGRRRILITKPKILGFGMNLQIATRHVFSGLQDSYESYYQAVKRSNRVGSTQPLNVHIPITDIEAPMIQTVLRKAAMVADDTRAQEQEFKRAYGK